MFAGSGPFHTLLKLYAEGRSPDNVEMVEEGKMKPEVAEKVPKESFYKKALRLMFCACGLVIFYLTWGIMQERIMAFKYGKTADSEGENFTDSLFLVFVNRIFALMIASVVVKVKSQLKSSPPLYKYSYSSISNIMSSWFQFEALKFVSFPVQVLAKACKVIPVMIMGKFVSKRSYELHEYLTACMISLGVSMFLLTSDDAVRGQGPSTTLSGIVILLGYLSFDSFTSNWQGELFTTYKVTSFQMMLGVNLFSVIFTIVSLLEQGGFIDSVAFMGRHPEFIQHALILGACSALGQLFIYYTISQFGAVTFTIIMTVRQGFSFLASCIIYRHPVTLLGLAGIGIVFVAMFLRIHLSRIPKSKAKPDDINLNVNVSDPQIVK
mgnify:CR=1 FL=1